VTDPGRKLDWSRSGCIVSVSGDGHTVRLRSFQCNEKDAVWQLSEPSSLQLPTLHEESHITHVSWNTAGSFLTVIDNSGRISIYASTAVLGKLDLKRSGIVDHGDESNAVVCCYWLYVFPLQQKTTPQAWAASRDNNQWSYRILPGNITGAHHPIDNKQAMLCVTRSGTIRLLYQFDDGWLETAVDMETIGSTKHALTHADILAENGESSRIPGTAGEY
jgi:mediator of RNA polymerase II transcription subunit 16, fungi type